MLTHITPQSQKGGDVKMFYIQDHVRAAVITLSVCKQYEIRLKDGECIHLCNELCLPKLEREDFKKYWADFSRDVAFLKRFLNFSLNLE